MAAQKERKFSIMEDFSTPATFSGWVKKKGAHVSDSYKKRWFELRENKLYYFSKQGAQPPKGVIDLNTAEIVLTAKQYGFAIKGPNLPRTYLLQAFSDSEKTAWYRTLEQTINKFTEQVESELISEVKKDLKTEQVDFGAGKGDATKTDDNASLANAPVSDGIPSETLESFDLLTVVGRGSFGKVIKCRHKKTKEIFAMKVLRKEVIVKENLVQATKLEKNLLATLKHPFIVRLHYAFQSEDKLYLVLDFLSGGELFFHLSENGRFSEARTRLYLAEIGSAIHFLHSLNIIYRDLKPENIVLDKYGHACMTDFGLAKKDMRQGDSTKTFCGTPEYLAPEILKGEGYTLAVDWWSLGVLAYEMLVGLPPFYSENVNDMYELILKQQLKFPAHVSAEARSLIAGLLDRDPRKRTTGDGFRKHPFMKSIDWDQLLKRQIKPEFVPQLLDDSDVKYFDPEFTEESLKKTLYKSETSENHDDAAKLKESFNDFDFSKTN